MSKELPLRRVPISRQQLQQELPHQDLQVLEQNVRPAMWAVGRSSSSAGAPWLCNCLHPVKPYGSDPAKHIMPW
jgi:hypothetical protein